MEGSMLKNFILLPSDYCNGLLADVPAHIIKRPQLVWNVAARIQFNTRSNKHINSGFHVINIRDGNLLLLPHILCSSGELRQNCSPLVLCPLSLSESSNISLGRVFHCQIESDLNKRRKNPFNLYQVFFICSALLLSISSSVVCILASAQLNFEASELDRVYPLAFWVIFLCDTLWRHCLYSDLFNPSHLEMS